MNNWCERVWFWILFERWGHQHLGTIFATTKYNYVKHSSVHRKKKSCCIAVVVLGFHDTGFPHHMLNFIAVWLPSVAAVYSKNAASESPCSFGFSLICNDGSLNVMFDYEQLCPWILISAILNLWREHISTGISDLYMLCRVRCTENL